MALMYKITTEERVTLSVDAEAFKYQLWLRGETPSYNDQARCIQLQVFLLGIGLRYVVLSWTIEENNG